MHLALCPLVGERGSHQQPRRLATQARPTAQWGAHAHAHAHAHACFVVCGGYGHVCALVKAQRGADRSRGGGRGTRQLATKRRESSCCSPHLFGLGSLGAPTLVPPHQGLGTCLRDEGNLTFVAQLFYLARCTWECGKNVHGFRDLPSQFLVLMWGAMRALSAKLRWTTTMR